MNWTTYILLVLVLARWVIAIQLTRVGLRQKLSNLLWLAAVFYITGTGDIFYVLSPLTGTVWPWLASIGLGEIALVMFIHLTFYRDRKSPVLIFMAIAIAFFVMDAFFAKGSVYFSPFNWLWLIVAGYQAHKQIAADKAMEDWVKARYKLVVAYSVAAMGSPILTIVSVMGMFVPALAGWLFSPTIFPVVQLVNLSFTILGIVVEYLAWVMPEGFRRFLNRKYQAPAAVSEMSEEELMRQFA